MTEASCPVCLEVLAAPNVASCHACRREFHLQMRMDVQGKDCGEVWLHEFHSYLIFGCSACIAAGEFDEAQPPARGEAR